ncbi:Na+/H+ antiporter subunit E [Chelativorans sp.]|uniref:Na+/H+ antiporter subunit E n=1 Tax=Chelativorans sp. TaxID=2203393 RepID=UPI002811A684|nr:Na+/H+ antiporter subunit E [Chelativorans sp.]
MRLPLMNLLLALVWTAVTGSLSLANMIFGLVLGAVALYLIREQVGSLGYFRRSSKIIALTCLFLYELVLSAWRVAMLVLSPRMELRPGIFSYPLTVDRDFEITLLANMITLTPGTLSVDVSEDRKLLYVHALDCADVEQLRKDIAEGFERRIMEAFR